MAHGRRRRRRGTRPRTRSGPDPPVARRRRPLRHPQGAADPRWPARDPCQNRRYLGLCPGSSSGTVPGEGRRDRSACPTSPLSRGSSGASWPAGLTPLPRASRDGDALPSTQRADLDGSRRQCRGPGGQSQQRQADRRLGTTAAPRHAGRADRPRPTVPLKVTGAFTRSCTGGGLSRRHRGRIRSPTSARPVIANQTATAYRPGDDVTAELIEQVVSPVLWADCVANAYDHGSQVFSLDLSSTGMLARMSDPDPGPASCGQHPDGIARAAHDLRHVRTIEGESDLAATPSASSSTDEEPAVTRRSIGRP